MDGLLFLIHRHLQSRMRTLIPCEAFVKLRTYDSIHAVPTIRQVIAVEGADPTSLAKGVGVIENQNAPVGQPKCGGDSPALHAHRRGAR